MVDLTTGRTLSVEALIRWNRPGHGVVGPDKFIPLAERSLLIEDIDRWVLRTVCEQIVQWGADPELSALTVAVNISGRHLSSATMVDDVQEALAASGAPPHKLVVELTETVLARDSRAIDNMHRLREMGVQLALDDFGTGYTSINQLAALPIDILKIDRSFTTSENPRDRVLVELMVTAAHMFDLSVVAEGLETAEQVDSLRLNGADHAQGYFFARPQGAADLPGAIGPHQPFPRPRSLEAHTTG